MSKRHTWIAVVIAVALCGLAGCDWPMARFDAGRTAHNPLSGVSADNASRLGAAWSVTGQGFPVGTPSPVVLEANGVVLYQCATQINCFAAANASDGTFRWSSPVWPGAIDGTTVYGTVAADPQQSDYKLTALALGSGAISWSVASKTAGGGLGGTGHVVAVDQGKVFVVTDSHPNELDVWDAASRRVIWTVQGLIAGPAIANGRAFVVQFMPQGGNPLYALDENTGHQIWSAPANIGSCDSDVVVSGSYLFTDGATYRTQDGTVVSHWAVCPGNFSFAVDGTEAFAVLNRGATADSNELVSFDGLTGALRWSAPIGLVASGAPVIGDHVVFISNQQHILGFDTTNGSPVSVVPGVGAIVNDPVLGQGLLLATTFNKVYAWRPT